MNNIAGLPTVDFIYFDLGKVILEFDHQIGCRKISQLAGITSDQAYSGMFDTGIEVKFETGLITGDQFHRSFCDLTGGRISKDDLLHAMSDIFHPNLNIFPLIAQLRAANFPIGILSNTCVAHWQYVVNRFSILRSFFSPIILSYEVNSMKPDSKIYNRAIEMAGCHVEKCFFVDDKQVNVDGAISAGMDAVLYRSVPELVDELLSRGVVINL